MNLANVTAFFALAIYSPALAAQSRAASPSSNTDRAEAIRIATLIKDRTSMVCDGNLRQLLASYIIEYKDAKSYITAVQFTPPKGTDKLNYPDFRGTYTISFSISPAPVYYREIESFFPKGFDDWKNYSDRVLDSWLLQNDASLWSARRNVAVKPVPLVVSVQNYGGKPYVSNVVIANDLNWAHRERVNYAFMPVGPYIETMNINVGKANEDRIIGFWNYVANIKQPNWFPQTCETYNNPAKVAATAFLNNGDARSAHVVYEKFVSFYETGPFFTSAKWRNAVYRSVGANFAFSNFEHRAAEPVDAADEP